MKQQINLLLLCLVLLSLVRNVVPKGAPDNDAPEHIFGTYDEDGKYHKEINFADLDTVPETITLTAYDAVVDDPITTQAIPTPSTLLGPLLGPSAESSADIDFFNLDLELKDFLLDDLEAASSSSAHGGATALLQMNTNQRHAKAKRKVHAKSNAKSQTQKQAQHQRKHTQQTHAIARANVTAEFKPVEQYEYIGQYKKDKLLGQGKFGEVWSFTVPDRPDLPGVSHTDMFYKATRYKMITKLYRLVFGVPRTTNETSYVHVYSLFLPLINCFVNRHGERLWAAHAFNIHIYEYPHNYISCMVRRWSLNFPKHRPPSSLQIVP